MSKPRTTKTSKSASDFTDFPETAKAMAEQTVDQAQAAAEKAGEIAHGQVQVFDASANAFKNNAAEIQLKAIEFAQANLNSVFTFSRTLLSADKPETAFEASGSFASELAQTMFRQAGELNELTMKLAQETAKPVQESAAKSLEAASKEFAA